MYSANEGRRRYELEPYLRSIHCAILTSDSLHVSSIETFVALNVFNVLCSCK